MVEMPIFTGSFLQSNGGKLTEIKANGMETTKKSKRIQEMGGRPRVGSLSKHPWTNPL